MKRLLSFLFSIISIAAFAQVDTTFIFNTSTPFGTLDIRLAKSSTRYYYLEEGKTFSFRESASGVRTNTFNDMTSWNSSDYTEGNLREQIGTSDAFIMNYRLLFPQGYNASYQEGYPLIVMVHGAGERGNCWTNTCYWDTRSWKPSTNDPPAPTNPNHALLNNDHNLSHGGKPHLDARNLAGTKLPGDPSLSDRAFPGFVLFPQNMNGWDANTIQDAIRLIRLAIKKYNIDPNRVYVHGLSNGGIGTYEMIKRAPWLFAAALPMSAPSDAGIISRGLIPSVAHIPLWTFQGGLDTNPPPNRTEGYVKRFREAGVIMRYTMYPNLGHGTWNDAYKEPDFFSWMRSKRKNNLHVFYENPTICALTGQGVTLGFSDGFLAYQWEKDGQIISNATAHEYVATQPGVYRARFSRQSTSPSSGEWEDWSQPVTVTLSNPPKPEIFPLTTTHLRGPDNTPPNIIELKAGTETDKYFWYKDGVRINIPNNADDDTVSLYTINSTSSGSNGAYTLATESLDGCTSPKSDPLNLFFNNSAPYLSDNNIPTNFRVTSKTSSSVALAWQDNSSAELAYEIWRRAPGDNFVFAGRTNANAETFTDTELHPSTLYEYKIRAVNNSGRSRYAPGDNLSNNLNVTTGNDSEAPTAPQSLRVVNNTINSISLKWNAATDDTGLKQYVIYYGSQSVETNSVNTSFTLENLRLNQSYQITVKAEDHAGHLSPPSNAVTGTTSVTGLWYGHSTGAWNDLDEINWSQPEFTGHVPNVTLEPRTQEEYFNFEFKGYLFIETGGTYYFYLNSDDGSRLYIDDVQVVDFDGLHGKTSENGGFGKKSAAVSLTSGAHTIRVVFFENTGGEYLTMAYQGADTQNQNRYIPDEALTSGTASGPTNNAPVITITNPDEGQEFTAPATINITANASDSDGSVSKVEFYNGEAKLGEDTNAPYAFEWKMVATGNYTISAIAFDNDGATKTSSEINLVVKEGETQACAGTGSITREVWTDVTGGQVANIPVNTTPALTETITIFEGPTNTGDNYGTRIRGFICPPASGDYRFWIASNDHSELWLSTNDDPQNRIRIAYVSGATSPRQWDKYSSQASDVISLNAGQRYYIEALQKEGVGSDNIAVGWQLPDGAFERPIPGARLMPFFISDNNSPVVNLTAPEDGAIYNDPANITINASASDTDGSISKVEFYSSSQKLGEDTNAPYSFEWNNVPPGNYSLTAKAFDNEGSISTSSPVQVSVEGSTGGATCSASGTITREYWNDVPGGSVADIPLNEAPTGTNELTLFEGPTNIGTNYGTRISGYICPPADGEYTFWIASNDNSELWLSTDDNPANKVRIASVTGATGVRQWTKYSSQQSSPITLQTGQRYYIEALHKQGVGSDNISVGWQLPDGNLERPIPGTRLSPAFDAAMTAQSTAARSASATEAEYEETSYQHSIASICILISRTCLRRNRHHRLSMDWTATHREMSSNREVWLL